MRDLYTSGALPLSGFELRFITVYISHPNRGELARYKIEAVQNQTGVPHFVMVRYTSLKFVTVHQTVTQTVKVGTPLCTVEWELYN